jgi:hypothetical protein
MIDTIPELRDEVKHILGEMSGIVITKYWKNGVSYLDVRGINDKIYYETPTSNWTVLKVCDE